MLTVRVRVRSMTGVHYDAGNVARAVYVFEGVDVDGQPTVAPFSMPSTLELEVGAVYDVAFSLVESAPPAVPAVEAEPAAADVPAVGAPSEAPAAPAAAPEEPFGHVPDPAADTPPAVQG